MGSPPVQKTWTITPNNVITYVSLNDVMANLLYGFATFLLANGYTCKGSSDGAAAAMDGTNRWLAPANAATRGANTTTAQSWMVLTDANGCDLCLAYAAANDYQCRISYSASGVYVAAGTATFTPTATDEIVFFPSTATGGLIDSTASLDRIWYAWVDADAKLCRLAVYRNGDLLNAIGLELVDSLLTQPFSPAVWAFYYAGVNFNAAPPGAAAGFYTTYSPGKGGNARILGAQVDIGGGGWLWLSNHLTFQSVDLELLGTAGYPMFGPFFIGTTTGSREGSIGKVFDWWSGRGFGGGGNGAVTYNGINYIQMFGAGQTRGIVWPWDGTTVPNTGGASGTETGNFYPNPVDPEYATPDNMAFGAYTPIVAPVIEPTAIALNPTSVGRRPGVDVLRILEMSGDPPADPDRLLLYWRTIDGVPALFARYPDGTVFQVGA